MAEECYQSDEKRVLRACTECGTLPGASGVLLKAMSYELRFDFCYDEPHGVFLGFCCGPAICSFGAPAKVKLH